MNRRFTYLLTFGLLLFGGVATAQNPSGVIVGGNVFGGGNLANVKGSCSVSITQPGSIVNGDVYGGGALADVNVTETINGEDTTYSYTSGKTTTVDLLDGTIRGNVYGGGLGDSIFYGGTQNIAAKVYGPVTVNIGKLDGGVNDQGFANGTDGNVSFGSTSSVYGCNNLNGTPLDNVEVNIYETAHEDGNYVSDDGYAIYQVFGGGNKANYEPASSGKKPKVHVWTCDNTIQWLYGGGNAANLGNSTISSASDVIIDGGRIEWVFGGGNGFSSTNNHTQPDQPNYNPGANIYGDASVLYRAGYITYLFGGSNEWGNITGSKTIDIRNDGNCAVENHIVELYGGNNKAPINNNIGATLNMPCPPSGSNPCQIDYLFGGSRDADISGDVVLNVYGGLYNYVFAGNNIGGTIYGNVTLNLFGGTINEAAFGGNNEGGAINGKITVNMMADEVCDLMVHNIYGGGYNACYNPTTVGAYPEVNLIHGIVSKKGDGTGGNVFGGGYGQTATVQSNPMVRVGYDATMDGYIPMGYPILEANRTAIVQNIVFGGGDMAAVAGSTHVILQNANSSVVSLFGGGNKASVGNATVDVIGGSASTGVYGGCNQSGTVGGAITPYTFTLDGSTNTYANTAGTPIAYDGTIEVNIKSNLGTSGSALVEGIYGGGKGSDTRTTGNVTVTITEDDDENVPIIYSDVYGGSALGWVGDGNGNDLTKVDFQNGTLHGVIYGGGMGDNNISAKVNGNVQVNIATGSISGGVYGGCNIDGNVSGDIAVNVNGGTVGAQGATANVHGGGYGNLTTTSGDVNVSIDGESLVIWGDVYGGSAKGHVNADDGDKTNVTLEHGTIHGDLYGGGLGDNTYAATVYGAVQVTVNGGTVTGSVYGCNNASGAPQSTVNVDIYATDQPASDYALGAVFGGGNQANFNGTPVVKVHNCNNKIEYVYGGGNAANVKGTDVTIYGGDVIGNVFGGCYGANVTNDGTNVKIYGGTILKVFGGNNHSGTITGDIKVNVDKQGDSDDNGSATACDMHITEVYGGGNLAASNAGTITVNCTGDEGEGIEYLYGGANDADVTGPIDLNIIDGRIQNVFGGNNTGHAVNGTITVNINKEASPCGWYIGNVYGGGNQATYGSANSDYPQVNILNGLVSGDVFGGGLGDATDPTKGVVTGNPQVTVDGANASVAGGVYGGGSLAPTVGNPLVTLTDGALTNVFGGGKAASVTGAPTVQIDGGSVSTGIYGGCHEQGNVSGNITVNVHDGTIGTETNLNQTEPIVAQVFGGGYGNGTSTSGNVEVNIGNATAGPAIYGDVYGGSALGNVNTENGNNTTTVNIMNGTLYTNRQNGTNVLGQTCYIYYGGNVFGGGLGRKANSSATPPVTAIEAKVYGDVTVNIGTGTVTNGYTPSSNTGYATIKGSIYGCNDQNGAPQKSVTVNVFATAHTTTDSYDYDPTENNNVPATYALANVFGGSRQADFLTGVIPLVNIYGCDNTIERTFGGCDAAESNSVETMIQGGHVHQAYGGGNGEINAANVDGNVTIGIHGGKVDSSFGGSNLQGEISGTSTISTDAEGGCGETHIEEQFGGGNFADVHGNVDAIFRCADGLFIENLYGGCKQADVLPNGAQIGNVHLVVEGGTYNNIFGGSQGRLPGTNGDDDPGKSADISGCILLEIHGGKVNNAIYGGSHILGKVNGTITVNIENMNTGCDLDVSTADVYGGGNEANYDTAPTQGENGYDYTHPNYPVINIKNATVRNVFGGGYKAEVKGNPQIHLKKGAKVLGNVYGGGNMGVVVGSPKVNVDGNDNTPNPHEIGEPHNED